MERTSIARQDPALENASTLQHMTWFHNTIKRCCTRTHPSRPTNIHTVRTCRRRGPTASCTKRLQAGRRTHTNRSDGSTVAQRSRQDNNKNSPSLLGRWFGVHAGYGVVRCGVVWCGTNLWCCAMSSSKSSHLRQRQQTTNNCGGALTGGWVGEWCADCTPATAVQTRQRTLTIAGAASGSPKHQTERQRGSRSRPASVIISRAHHGRRIKASKLTGKAERTGRQTDRQTSNTAHQATRHANDRRRRTTTHTHTPERALASTRSRCSIGLELPLFGRPSPAGGDAWRLAAPRPCASTDHDQNQNENQNQNHC